MTHDVSLRSVVAMGVVKATPTSDTAIVTVDLLSLTNSVAGVVLSHISSYLAR